MSNEQSAAPQGPVAAATGGFDARQAAGRTATAAEFPELSAERRPDTHGDIRLDAILDVPVIVSMEIGRSRISIRNLLQLNQGSVVELDRLAGEPMDVLVNGTLVAQGEVVVVNDKFGIRLTDIISPSERVKRLRG
jgi:flagellar motor switch protein FliN/FliY